MLGTVPFDAKPTLEFGELKIGHCTAFPALLCFLPNAAFSQPCFQDQEVRSPSGIDYIEVAMLGGRMMCPSIYWLTADGQLHGVDNRLNSGPRVVSASTLEGEFRELLEMALAAREASRQWLEDNPLPEVADRLQSLFERVKNADGYCQRYSDGVDVSVSVSMRGQTYRNECVGGRWSDFQGRFFELVDDAIEPAQSR